MNPTNFDLYKLTSDEEPILSRMDRFLSVIEELGYDPTAITHGALDEHMLSAALGVTPQVVRMFFGLYISSDEERSIIEGLNLDTNIIAVMMMIDPRIREAIYDQLEEFLKESAPITSIFEFIDDEEYRTTIRKVFDQTPFDYWAAVAGLLKDKEFEKGTITKNFRSMLMNFKKFKKASDKQLNWLERALIHDYENEFGIFTAQQLQKQFPEAVENIEQYLKDYEHYECVEDQEGE